MKKAIMITLASAILSNAAFAATPTTSASAFENVFVQELPKYYDFNRDGNVTVSDLVVGFQLLDEGALAKTDIDNVYALLFKEEIEVGFEEFDIDALEATPENIAYLQMVCSGYCCDSEIDGSCSRFRVINDGKVTEIRCSTPGDPNVLSIPISFDIMNPFSISNGRFVTRPPEFTYSVSHFNNLSSKSKTESLEQTFDTYKFEKIEVINSAARDEVHVYFSGFSHTSELIFTNFSDEVDPIRTFQYDGTEVKVGVTPEGKIGVTFGCISD